MRIIYNTFTGPYHPPVGIVGSGIFGGLYNGSKKIVNKKVIAFDFHADLINNNLLLDLCSECGLDEVYVEIFTIEKGKEISQKLLNLGIEFASNPYKDDCKDLAIKTDICNLPILISTLSEHDFEEITVWSCNERWEQHLFLKSARRRIVIEKENDLYLCYKHAEKTVELYLNPKYDVDRMYTIINTYTNENNAKIKKHKKSKV